MRLAPDTLALPAADLPDLSAYPGVQCHPYASIDELATYMMSHEAPRYCLELDTAAPPDLVPHLGVRAGMALFSDDLSMLRRAAVRWVENGFEVFLDLAANYPEFAECEDVWALRARPHIPAWFTEEIFMTSDPARTPQTDPRLVEEMALAELCSECLQPFFIYDKATVTTLRFFGDYQQEDAPPLPRASLRI